MAHGPDRDLRDILTPGAAVLLPGAANALTARVYAASFLKRTDDAVTGSCVAPEVRR